MHNRLLAYASSRHLPYVEDYVPDVLKAKEQGYKGYKDPSGRRTTQGWTADPFLAHDPVQAYNRYEALKVGRLLDELDYLWYEDPIQTTDADGLVELAQALDVPLHVGEFLASISDFAEYIRRGAVDVVRLIADNVGGISGSMRVGLLGGRVWTRMHAA